MFIFKYYYLPKVLQKKLFITLSSRIDIDFYIQTTYKDYTNILIITYDEDQKKNFQHIYGSSRIYKGYNCKLKHLLDNIYIIKPQYSTIMFLINDDQKYNKHLEELTNLLYYYNNNQASKSDFMRLYDNTKYIK